MAFSVKIAGYSKTDGRMLLQMEPGWWNAQELIQDKRFVESRRRGIYYDYRADLSVEEVRELNKKYQANAGSLQKLLCFRFRKLSLPCQKLNDALFKRGDRYSHFHVNVIEWDSGL